MRKYFLKKTYHPKTSQIVGMHVCEATIKAEFDYEGVPYVTILVDKDLWVEKNSGEEKRDYHNGISVGTYGFHTIPASALVEESEFPKHLSGAAIDRFYARKEIIEGKFSEGAWQKYLEATEEAYAIVDNYEKEHNTILQRSKIPDHPIWKEHDALYNSVPHDEVWTIYKTVVEL